MTRAAGLKLLASTLVLVVERHVANHLTICLECSWLMRMLRGWEASAIVAARSRANSWFGACSAVPSWVHIRAEKQGCRTLWFDAMVAIVGTLRHAV